MMGCDFECEFRSRPTCQRKGAGGRNVNGVDPPVRQQLSKDSFCERRPTQIPCTHKEDMFSAFSHAINVKQSSDSVKTAERLNDGVKHGAGLQIMWLQTLVTLEGDWIRCRTS